MSKHDFEKKPNTTLTERARAEVSAIRKGDFTILCGRNNCGKSFLLKSLAAEIGESASYLGPQRYQNFNMLTPFSPQPRKRSEEYERWLRQWREATQNLDNSPINLQTAVAELSDAKREQLSEVMQSLLGAGMEILHTIPDNSMSQKYVAVNGHNLSYTSSGYRLVASLVSSLLSDKYDTYLIDEPELGVSPETQSAFADFLFDRPTRKKYFPHVKNIVIATHSTLFLDRQHIHNNCFVTIKESVIDIDRVNRVSDVNKIHFFLMGNRLESLYMPSAIVVVEGKTDHAFIERVLHTKYDKTQFSVIAANSDSRIRDIFHLTKSLFGDLQKSPYYNRMFAVIDSVHGDGLVQQLIRMGMQASNIIVWSRNGIEHYYPNKLLQEIFHSTDEITIEDDNVRCSGLEYKKSELSDMVVSRIGVDTEYSDEFRAELLSKIESACGIEI